MGFWKWLIGEEKPAAGTAKEVSCKDLFAAAADYTLRNLAFEICVGMVSNALGLCEFKTYQKRREIKDREYWLWNIEPNLNQNSSAFLHKLVSQLYRNNEALVVSFTHRSGYEMLAVADSWEQPVPQVTRMNEYRGVTVDGYTFSKTIKESDVLHLRLHQTSILPVLEAMTQAWANMVALARKHYEWDQGQHWKVHVDQLAAGADGFEAAFAQMIAEQVKPFLESPNGVLPEFDGYKYESLSGSSSGNGSSRSLSDIGALMTDIFNFTAQAFLIPDVLISGKVEATTDANNRFLTYVVDPLCDQLQEEANRKRYGYERWAAGDYLQIDSSSILHYDLFSQAASVEKLIGSGVYTINDILTAVGQAPINEPWANQHFLTKNIGKIEEVAAALGE